MVLMPSESSSSGPQPPYPLTPRHEAPRLPAAGPEGYFPAPATQQAEASSRQHQDGDDDDESDWEKDSDDGKPANTSIPTPLQIGRPDFTSSHVKGSSLPSSLRPGPSPGVAFPFSRSQDSFPPTAMSQTSLAPSTSAIPPLDFSTSTSTPQSNNPFLRPHNTGDALFGVESSTAVWSIPATSTVIYGEGPPAGPAELPAELPPVHQANQMSIAPPQAHAADEPLIQLEDSVSAGKKPRHDSEASSGWEPAIDISSLDALTSRGRGIPEDVLDPSRTWQEQEAWQKQERERREREAAAALEKVQAEERFRNAEEEWHRGEAEFKAESSRVLARLERASTDPLTEPDSKPTATAAATAPAAESSRRTPSASPLNPEYYSIKQIRWYDAGPSKIRMSPILIQNANGPCPLLALVNALLLSTPELIKTGLIEALRTREQISLGLLLEAVIDELVSGRRRSGAQELPDVSELYGFLKALHTGMNVNPRFTFVPDRSSAEIHPLLRPTVQPGGFEQTKEMTLYSTFNVPLIHGWIPARDSEIYKAFDRNAKTYEDSQNILFHEEELEHKLSHEGLSEHEQQLFSDLHLIKEYFRTWPTQLTDHGLGVLLEHVTPGSFAILFRNDHFSTLYKEPRSGQLLTLVTDAGFCSHEEIVWESLVDISGQNSELYSGDFRPVSHAAPPSSTPASNTRTAAASSSSLPPPPTTSNPSGPRGSSIASQSQSQSLLDIDDPATTDGWTTVTRRSRSSLPVLITSQQSTGVTNSSPTQPPQPSSTEPDVLTKSIQEDHDLAFALQLQEEEEARAADSQRRRHQSESLNAQVLEGQGRVAGSGPGGTGSTGRRRTASAQLGQQNIRPLIPPRRTNVSVNGAGVDGGSSGGGSGSGGGRAGGSSATAATTNRPTNPEDEPPPPSYEQAAQGPAFIPPRDHPASPHALRPDAAGSGAALPWASTGTGTTPVMVTGRRRRSQVPGSVGGSGGAGGGSHAGGVGRGGGGGGGGRPIGATEAGAGEGREKCIVM